MTNFKVNTDAIKKLLEDSSKDTFNKKGEWLSMAPGTHRLRIAPPFSSKGVPVRKIVLHQGFKSDGKFMAPVCYNFLFGPEEVDLLIAAKQKGLITAADADFYLSNGCPICKIKSTLYKQGRDAEAKNFSSRTQYLWNVVVRESGKMCKWSNSKQMATNILVQAEAYPELFSATKGKDFILHATGEGIARKYSSPAFMEPSPLDCKEPPHDLDEAVLVGVRHSDLMMKVATERLKAREE